MFEVGIWSEKYQTDLYDYLVKYSVQSGIELHINRNSVYDEFTDSLCRNIFDIVFLNIDLMETRRIAETIIRNPALNEMVIILVSEGCLCPAEFIRLHPYDFLSIPLKYRTLYNCLNSYVNGLSQKNKIFTFNTNKNKCMIKTTNVLYLQSVGKQMVLHTHNGEQLVFYGRLNECMQEECFSDFIKTHQSFAVNIRYVERFERNQVLIRGVWIPVSRARVAIVKERLNDPYC